MKKERNPFHIFNQYYLRTPLFSITNYKRFIEKDKLTNSDIKNILDNPVFRESLFLASKELLKTVEKWEENLITNPQKVERLKITILKYYTRISTRCTPFGLFASVNLGSFDKVTKIKLDHTEQFKRTTSLDYSILNKVLFKILENETIKKNLLFFPNSSLYKIRDHYRYMEYFINDTTREYSLEGIKTTTYLYKIIKKTKDGATIKNLALEITDKDVTFEEANLFINSLISNQVLISEIDLHVTGNDYLKSVLQILENYDLDEQEIYKTLKKLTLLLTELDSRFTNSTNKYSNILVELNKITPISREKNVFQTIALSSTSTNTINNEVKNKLYKALRFFNQITTKQANKRLDEFKKAFTNRYEHQSIPLNIALDIETGINYGNRKHENSSLIENILFSNKNTECKNITWTDFDQILLKKLYQTIENGQTTIELSEEDITNYSRKWDDLPDTISSLIEVYDNDQIYIKNINGSSASRLLGRFSVADVALQEHINDILKIEENNNKNKIIAEIVHLPEVRTGNVLHRAFVRGYEIPYLGKSNVKKNHQIPLEDIMVSVQNNKIILFSKKHNKEIIPRLSNAHNYNYDSLPIYHFLCELQTQNKRSSIGFNWNPICLKLPYLPRVEYKGILFSKAKWLIHTKEIEKIINSSDRVILNETKKWQEKLNLPDYLELVENDHKLLIYLKNITSIKMLIKEVKNKEKFILQEFLFTDNKLVKKGNEFFTNEAIVSFFKKPD